MGIFGFVFGGGDVFETWPHVLVWAGLKLLILLRQLFLLVGIQRVYFHSHIRNSTCGVTAEGGATGGRKSHLRGDRGDQGNQTRRNKVQTHMHTRISFYIRIYMS